MNPLLKTPSSDFASVRDGRNSLPLYIDVDLTAARSIGSNSHLILNISGNSFYSDQNANQGIAIVHFQDTNLGSASSPITVNPGFIANVGYTQILIENSAQAGKRLRIFYGVDIDFVPGTGGQVTIAGRVDVNDVVSSSCQIFIPSTPGTVGTVVTPVFLPAANANGFLLRDFTLTCAPSTNAGGVTLTLIAALTAPTLATNPKTNAINLGVVTQGSVLTFSILHQHGSINLPAGWGIWVIEEVVGVVAYNHVYLSGEML